ncbi:multicopper oxidase [Apiospora arundinis]|uniref:Multicopper oxidase n=1 Tax=Apiospora arundinis TaxID=335852 RepID=A0ABR2I3M6_9PEZI
MRFHLSSLISIPLVSAKTLEFYWELSWKFVAPDGFGRPVVSVNNMWPPPTIEGVVGDRIVVHVNNRLGNETSSIHWHGLQQVGQNTMDGPSMVTQCPIPPGSRFTYDFHAGTYWWHAHVPGQIADGLRGPMYFKDPHAPYKDQIDGELSITLGDWYHTQAPFLIEQYESAENAAAGGPEPIPDTGLINSGQNVTVKVDDRKTYLLRVVNLGNFVGTYFEVEGHQLTIVEANGNYMDPVTVNRLYLTVAQRYAVLITLKPRDSKEGAILIKAQLDTTMFDSIPANYNPNFYGYLVHDDRQSLPSQKPITNLTVVDDLTLVTAKYNPFIDQVDAYDHVDHQIIINMDFTTINNQNRAIIDNVTYVEQKVPTLYTALSVGSFAENPIVYGRNTNPSLIKSGEVVEVIINNHDDGSHPWHTHGYSYQIIARSPANGGDYPGGPLKPPSPRPCRRDTITVNAGSFVAFRFLANNPGVHLFHCHIEWHVVSGLVATLIETPTSLQGHLYIPRDHLDSCHRFGIPTAGNAAGNERHPLDLAGANTQPPPTPMGALVNASALRDPARPRKGHPAWPYWPEKGHHHRAGY